MVDENSKQIYLDNNASTPVERLIHNLTLTE